MVVARGRIAASRALRRPASSPMSALRCAGRLRRRAEVGGLGVGGVSPEAADAGPVEAGQHLGDRLHPVGERRVAAQLRQARPAHLAVQDHAHALQVGPRDGGAHAPLDQRLSERDLRGARAVGP